MRITHIWRVLALFAFAFSLAPALQAALPTNTTVFEVRPTASGAADTNGGCFVSGGTGNDYSLQGAAQFSGTNLVLPTTTTASSVTHNFASTDVDNCIQITAGTNCTVGFYRIISVAANVATLDRVAGTTGCTAGTWALGGALVTVSAALNVVVGSTIYVQATGNLTVTATTTCTTGNNGNKPIEIIGYTTTRTDGGRFTWTTATNSVNLLTMNGCQGLHVSNVNMTNTAVTRGICIRQTSTESNDIHFSNIVMDGCSRAVSASWGVESSDARELVFDGVEVKNSTTVGIQASADTVILNSYIHDNTGNGLDFNANGNGAQVGMTVINTIVKSNTGTGLVNNYTGGQSSIAFLIVYHSAFISNGSDGIKNASGVVDRLIAFNNVFDSNTGYGINSAGSPAFIPVCLVWNNAFYNNSTSTTTGVPSLCISGSVALTGSPFTSSSDFSLNNTSGQGAAIRGMGFPGTLKNGGTGHIDIGPLQHGDPFFIRGGQ